MKKTAERRIILKIRAPGAFLARIARYLSGRPFHDGLHVVQKDLHLSGNRLSFSLSLPPDGVDTYLLTFSKMLDEILSGQDNRAQELDIEVCDADSAECVTRPSVTEIGGGWKVLVMPDYPCTQEQSRPIPPDTLLLQAGWAFGSGRHPSTRGTVAAMNHLYRKGVMKDAHVLDVGTGTGILALLAARMGAARVTAVDIDQRIIETARQNVEINGLSSRITVLNKPIETLNLKKQDVIVANLTPSVLSGLVDKLVDNIEARGYLLLSGYRSGSRANMGRILRRCAMEPCYSLDEEGWSSEIFRCVRSRR